MKYIMPILLRYSSLALQFFIVVLVTRLLTKEEAGIYFMVFGIINATYFLFGAGLPDGLVRFVALAEATEKKEEIRSMIARSTVASLAMAAVMMAIGVGLGATMAGGLLTMTIVVATAAWWFAYGATFFAAQVLVATGRSSQGAFFFYPAMNITLFVTSVPYLLLSSHPTLELTLLAAVGGGVICTIVAVISALRATLVYPRSTIRAPLAPIFRLGVSIAISRVLQSCLYWIPVWAVGVWQGAGVAAVFGTASRLNVAIAAVMAAIRFTIRPVIVRLSANNDWDGIGREARKTATLATAATLIALIGIVTIGPMMIALVFGEAYRDAAWILAVLMIGTLGESIGGAVDEVLKMTQRAHIVLVTLVLAVISEAAIIFLLPKSQSIEMAAAQAAVVLTMYIAYLVIVRMQNGIWVSPAPVAFVRQRLARKRIAGVDQGNRTLDRKDGK